MSERASEHIHFGSESVSESVSEERSNLRASE